MKNMVDDIIKNIQKNSIRPIESTLLFEDYIEQSIKNDKAITFYNWECPPRFLDKDKNNVEFVNYIVDLDSIFSMKKIDKYTEFPRVVEKNMQEKNILCKLKQLGIKFRFIKLIADTNVKYLTTESQEIIGEKKIDNKFMEFKNKIRDCLKSYPVVVETFLFSSLVSRYRKVYEESFIEIENDILEGKFNIVSENIIKQQIRRTKKHIGFQDEKKQREFSVKTIASYGAEGMVFEKLAKTDYFSNCVWLNIEEVNQRSIDITNCMRRRRGFSNLPMVFL